MNIKTIDSHIAWYAHGAFVAVVVYHRYAVAGVAFAHAARTRWPKPVAVANDVIDLSLAKHFIDHHAQRVFAVIKHRITHRFTRAHQTFELEFEVLARLRVGLHHGFERCGEQKAVCHAVLLHQFKGQFGAKAAIERDDGPAKVQSRQQRIHQSTGPGPVGGRPKY